MKLSRFFSLLLIITAYSCSSPKPAQNLDYGNISYEGGNGKNYKKAVVIRNADNMNQGMKAIRHYLTETYGKQGPDWVMFSKGQKEQDGREYYLYEIALKDKKRTKIIYFDVTGFWGKY
ncbi:MAG: hypothetical protein K9G58_06165 [Bacteroidales bacterium]|nr:hypothetical protein [Bacteroidales bacterium]MCF8386616.1 hypothetical protein [Bacteroidales bacterium]MCF8397732.1 hypothetical protein [Bacteroidales bacterium]